MNRQQIAEKLAVALIFTDTERANFIACATSDRADFRQAALAAAASRGAGCMELFALQDAQ